MRHVTYWFRATDDHRQPSVEWLRQTGAAIAAASSVVPWKSAEVRLRPWVEVYVGSVTAHPWLAHQGTAEGVSFRADDPTTLDRILDALRHLGASRGIAITCDDAVAENWLARFALLYRGKLLRFGWWGRSNERSLRNYTGLRTLCARDEVEDARLLSAFGGEDAAATLSAFHATAMRRCAR